MVSWNPLDWFSRDPESSRRLSFKPFASGDIFSFRTSPASKYSEPDTGRYAAIKVLAETPAQIVVVVLDGIWTKQPTLAEARKCSVLCNRRGHYSGKPAATGIPTQWGRDPSMLAELTLLGTAPLSHLERTLLADLRRHATWLSVDRDAEMEWRWLHDRVRYDADMARVQADADVERKAKQERYDQRLKSLTWEILLGETPFQRWTPSPPYPPNDFTIAAREVVHQACRDLAALGDKPKRKDVRVILKACVEWFNEADEKAGNVIETEEREDICAVFEEVAFVARQRALVDEIDEWRSW